MPNVAVSRLVQLFEHVDNVVGSVFSHFLETPSPVSIPVLDFDDDGHDDASMPSSESGDGESPGSPCSTGFLGPDFDDDARAPRDPSSPCTSPESNYDDSKDVALPFELQSPSRDPVPEYSWLILDDVGDDNDDGGNDGDDNVPDYDWVNLEGKTAIGVLDNPRFVYCS